MSLYIETVTVKLKTMPLVKQPAVIIICYNNNSLDISYTETDIEIQGNRQ